MNSTSMSRLIFIRSQQLLTRHSHIGMDSMCIARAGYPSVNLAVLKSNGSLTLAINVLLLFLRRTLERVLTIMEGLIELSRLSSTRWGKPKPHVDNSGKHAEKGIPRIPAPKSENHLLLPTDRYGLKYSGCPKGSGLRVSPDYHQPRPCSKPQTCQVRLFPYCREAQLRTAFGSQRPNTSWMTLRRQSYHLYVLTP